MDETKLMIAALALMCAVSCSHETELTWQKFPMDGHRTGVVAPNADNTVQALGTVDDSVYVSPNGTKFAAGTATYAVAKDMISVQPQMSRLKEVIGYSTEEMTRRGPECALGDWAVDHLSEDVAKITGKKVDVGIINLGGIRVDMPKGDIIRDDIESMFPFKNYLCYVALKGEDLQKIFEFMAQTMVQPVSGVKIVVKDRQVDTLLVGGKPVDPQKIYGVATIDFLLDGGDGLKIAKNAQELVITDKKILDSIMPYVLSLKEAGKPVEYKTDGRVTVIGGRPKK